MVSAEERMAILRMVEEGKISPEEGARLLAALGEREPAADPEPEPASRPLELNNGRQFRVRVSNAATGKQKVSINIPVGLVDMGLRFVPPNSKFDVQPIREALRTGVSGRIVDVYDEEKGDRVEIFIE